MKAGLGLIIMIKIIIIMIILNILNKAQDNISVNYVERIIIITTNGWQQFHKREKKTNKPLI